MPQIIVVADKPDLWKVESQEVRFVTPQEYVSSPEFFSLGKGVRVFNLCNSYKYQSMGYYVSLLAGARGHRATPSVSCLQDMRSSAIVKLLGEDLEDLIDRNLRDLASNKFTLSIYFGRNIAKKYDRLASALFNMFHAPMIRAFFYRPNGKWVLQRVIPIGMKDIPPEHWDYVREFAAEHFSGKKFSVAKRSIPSHSMAILVDSQEEEGPSDKGALEKFRRAAEKNGFDVEFIEKEDFSRIPQFDALFIRATTHVNHFTFKFSQRAAAEGLVVIDDPISILRCTNKVFLSEILNRHKISAPKTLIVSRETTNSVLKEIGLPCILKQPDSAFSKGVVKVDTVEEFERMTQQLLATSDLLLAQEFLPTDFDWRVGIMDKEPLYVCKYYMARKHWQIVNWANNTGDRYGRYETLVPELAPPQVIKTALKAASHIGNGLYGVDIKQVGKECYVIEINDNPSIDSGIEDKLLKNRLYDIIMKSFARRVREQKEGLKGS